MTWQMLFRFSELIIGGMMLFSGLRHNGNPYHFMSAIGAYGLLPEYFVVVAAFALSGLMVSLGACLVCNCCARVARHLSLFLFGLFFTAQLILLIQGKDISCGCFGFSPHPISFFSASIPLFAAIACLFSILFADDKVFEDAVLDEPAQ